MYLLYTIYVMSIDNKDEILEPKVYPADIWLREKIMRLQEEKGEKLTLEEIIDLRAVALEMKKQNLLDDADVIKSSITMSYDEKGRAISIGWFTGDEEYYEKLGSPKFPAVNQKEQLRDSYKAYI